MSKPFGWAIVGLGRIAQRFAEALQRTASARMVRVYGRNAIAAGEFCAKWQATQADRIEAGSDFAAVLADPLVQAVYIASTHNAHFDLALACINAGKPVLCEKPLCMNVAQTIALVQAASTRGVFLMEALWTRYLPAYERIGQWLQGGRIGRLKAVQSSFCFHVPYNADTAASRIYNPALAGGCVLDIGVYNLSMTRWAMAQELARLQHRFDAAMPQITHASGSLAPNGVDQHVLAHMRLQHEDADIQAQFVCAFDCAADNRLRLFGELGYIETGPKFWQTTSASLHVADSVPEFADCAFGINGFEYELAEAMRCIGAGAIESPHMTHAETLATAQQMAELRAQLGAVGY